MTVLSKLTRMPFVAATPSSIGKVDYEAALLERDILEDEALLHWFRADSLFGMTGWGCRKSGAIAAPFRTALPTLVTSGAVSDNANGKPGLQFGAGATNGALRLPGGLPLNQDYSIILAAWAPPSAAHQVFWSDDQETSSTNCRRVANTDDIDLRHEGALICGPVGALSPASPDFIVCSYEKATKDGVILVNGVQVGTYRTDRGEILDGALQFGCSGDVDTPLQPLTGGVIYEAFVYGAPIHKDATRLARTQNTYGLPRYGLAA